MFNTFHTQGELTYKLILGFISNLFPGCHRGQWSRW